MADTFHAIVREGKIVEEYGGAKIVPWCSFTKTVIAATALTLVRDGALDLDAEIEDEAYTLRQLLQHRAGLCDYGELGDYQAAVARGDTPWPVEEMLQRAGAERLRYKPDHGWRYSNIGYLFAGRIIERACGAFLGSILTRRVFEPLGLNTIRLAVTPSDLVGVEMGQAKEYDPAWVYHGLLVGSVEDAALLLDRLLGGALLPRTLITEMIRAHPVEKAVVPDRPWRAPGYGLGVMMEAPDGPVGHTGGGIGSTIAVYRSRNRPVPQAVAVFASGSSAGEVEHSAFAKLNA
jgi:CubicO group peptidase (beta-lactamase class C family)